MSAAFNATLASAPLDKELRRSEQRSAYGGQKKCKPRTLGLRRGNRRRKRPLLRVPSSGGGSSTGVTGGVRATRGCFGHFTPQRPTKGNRWTTLTGRIGLIYICKEGAMGAAQADPAVMALPGTRFMPGRYKALYNRPSPRFVIQGDNHRPIALHRGAQSPPGPGPPPSRGRAPLATPALPPRNAASQRERSPRRPRHCAAGRGPVAPGNGAAQTAEPPAAPSPRAAPPAPLPGTLFNARAKAAPGPRRTRAARPAGEGVSCAGRAGAGLRGGAGPGAGAARGTAAEGAVYKQCRERQRRRAGTGGTAGGRPRSPPPSAPASGCRPGRRLRHRWGRAGGQLPGGSSPPPLLLPFTGGTWGRRSPLPLGAASVVRGRLCDWRGAGDSSLPGRFKGTWGYTSPCEGRGVKAPPPPTSQSRAAHPRAVPAPERLARRTDRPWGRGGGGGRAGVWGTWLPGGGRAGEGARCVAAGPPLAASASPPPAAEQQQVTSPSRAPSPGAGRPAALGGGQERERQRRVRRKRNPSLAPSHP